MRGNSLDLQEPTNFPLGGSISRSNPRGGRSVARSAGSLGETLRVSVICSPLSVIGRSRLLRSMGRMRRMGRMGRSSLLQAPRSFAPGSRSRRQSENTRFFRHVSSFSSKACWNTRRHRRNRHKFSTRSRCSRSSPEHNLMIISPLKF